MSKTHFRKIKDPNYLGSWDLMTEDGKFENKVLTIDHAGKEKTNDHRGQKVDAAILYFKDAKPMFLNSTNVKMVAKVCRSPYIEDWAGKQIEITVKQVRAFGDIHDALRVTSKVIAAAPVDLSRYITMLNQSDSLEALKTAWTNLPSDIKKNAEILGLKETIKSKLS